MPRPRIRDLGLAVGNLPTGTHNAITDVDGVRVGHTTLISGEGPLVPGQGPVRTGVTVILPHGDDLFQQKVCAAVHTINGFGKVRGFEEVRELGVIESPIALTNTLNVGLVADALVQYVVRHNPDIGIRTSTANVIVGETNDGYLNDLQGRHVRAEHVWAAIEAASAGLVTEGAVGAGTGTSCFGWKGGIGTASRVLPETAGAYTVGALVQSNFGRPRDLMVYGTPVGRHIQPPSTPKQPAQENLVPLAAPVPGALRGDSAEPSPRGRGSERMHPPISQDNGSIMVVLATDAPLTSRQLRRLCVRAAAGLARTGSHYGHGSGDFVIAFSTAHRIPHYPKSLTTTQTVLADEGKAMYWLFPAVVESVEEAVLNSMFQAETVVGRDGHTRYGLPVEKVAALVREGRA